MKHFIDIINAHPRYLAWLGTVSGWASFDFLRSAQIAAALLAASVSICALVLTAPKAWEQVKLWLRGIIAAFITGASTAGLSALGVTAADAAGAEVGALNLKQLGIICLSGGIVGVFAYLQRSPLPQLDETRPPFSS